MVEHLFADTPFGLVWLRDFTRSVTQPYPSALSEDGWPNARLINASQAPGTLISDHGEVYTPPPRPDIVQFVREKRSRKKAGDMSAKPGKSSCEDEWVKASEARKTGEFYTKLARLYTAKYGFNLGDNEDFAVDVVDPPDWVANKVVNERLTAEEAASRQAYWKTCQMWYDKRIKPQVEAQLTSLPGRAKFTGEEVHAINVQNEVTHECWEEESEEFKAEMVRQRDREHEITMKAWRESAADSPSRTPEEYHASLRSAAHYLQPFVDAIAERYGMCVSLLMCGPIGDQGGRIQMRSVHAGKTRGLVAKDWPMQDVEGFTQVEARMVEFAHNVFSQAECDARREGVAQEPEDTIPALRPPPAPPAARGPQAGPAREARGGASQQARGGTGGEDDGEGGGRDGDDIRDEGEGGGEGRGPDSDGDGEGGGGEGEDGAGEGEGGATLIERLWKRRDRSKWTEELKRAHVAFERGKGWGIEWAACVARLPDHRRRPSCCDRVVDWERRKWDKQVDIGVLGDAMTAETYVAKWWGWWAKVAPNDRSDLSSVLKLHGRNGLLHVMASLLWWGELVAESTPEERAEWLLGVEDMAELLSSMLKPGVIRKARKEATGAQAPKKRKRKRMGTSGEAARKGKDKEEGRRTKRTAQLFCIQPLWNKTALENETYIKKALSQGMGQFGRGEEMEEEMREEAGLGAEEGGGGLGPPANTGITRGDSERGMAAWCRIDAEWEGGNRGRLRD
ncbi:hypothetical protein B0H12DRAFT_1082447 [Mycena haematopus]|nr:hypothetical protein B0H12DRAFT_1082447 [Mycena haematopus]